MRDNYWHNMAAKIQRAWRRYARRKVDAAIVLQRWWRTRREAGKITAFRNTGHTLLRGSKERRRFSLYGERRFVGDYLWVDGESGAEFRRIAQLSASEVVKFSMRGEVLVSKFGRSSTPSPRFIILTDRNFLILVSRNGENGLETTVEQQIQVGQIAKVSMTNLQDDWVVGNRNYVAQLSELTSPTGIICSKCNYGDLFQLCIQNRVSSMASKGGSSSNR